MSPRTADDVRPLYALLGADSEIGTALARRLEEKGAALLLGGRDKERTEGLASELGGAGMEVDDRRLDEVQAFISTAAEPPWKLSGIINCSESLLLQPHERAPTEQRGREDEDQLVAAHLAAAFATVRGAGEVLGTGGRLILVTAASPDPLPDRPAYRSAGSNLAALLRSAQDVYEPRGIRIEAVAPGPNGADIAHLISTSWVDEIVERLDLPPKINAPDPDSGPQPEVIATASRRSPESPSPSGDDPMGDPEFETRSSGGSAWLV